MCPGDLLGIIESLVGDGGGVAIECLVSTLGNVEQAVTLSLGCWPAGEGPARGTACWQCGWWRWPPGPLCPQCGSAGGLLVPGLSAEQASWVDGLHAILAGYPGLAPLAAVGGWLMSYYLDCVHAWARHVHHRSHRWTDRLLPSVPILGRTAILCVWRSGPASDPGCPAAAPGTRWAYRLEAGRWILVCVRGPTGLSVAPARLLAPACRTCGLPSVLNAILDCQSLWERCPPGRGGPGCWHRPQDRPLTADLAGRASIPLG